MKNIFEAELEIIMFAAEDILTASIDLDDPDNYTKVEF